MAKYKIEYDRNSCIGAAICAQLNPENWTMVDDGKADLHEGGKHAKEFKPGWFSIEVDDISKIMEAAEGCPVNAIHIIDLEKEKKLI